MQTAYTQLTHASETLPIDASQFPLNSHQPAWYLNLDTSSRQLIDEVLISLDQRVPGLDPDLRAAIFWRALRKLGMEV